MIISHKYQCVYMSPGKTGTNSIEKGLKIIGGDPFVWGKEKGKWKYREPFDEDNIITMRHRCHLPEELKDYYVFASIRNPYERQMSRYLHGKRSKITPPSQKEFESFTFTKKTSRRGCYHLLRLYDDYEPPFGCVTYKISHFIRMETASEDFHNLPFVKQKIQFPHVNRSKFPEVKLYFTLKMAKHLWDVWAEEFEVFGYDKHFDLILL